MACCVLPGLCRVRCSPTRRAPAQPTMHAPARTHMCVSIVAHTHAQERLNARTTLTLREEAGGASAAASPHLTGGHALIHKHCIGHSSNKSGPFWGFKLIVWVLRFAWRHRRGSGSAPLNPPRPSPRQQPHSPEYAPPTSSAPPSSVVLINECPLNARLETGVGLSFFLSFAPPSVGSPPSSPPPAP